MHSTISYRFDVDDVAIGAQFAIISQGSKRLLLKNLLQDEVDSLAYLVRHKVFERGSISEKMFSSLQKQGLILSAADKAAAKTSPWSLRIPSRVVTALARPLQAAFSPLGLLGMGLLFVLLINLPHFHFAKVKDFSHWVMHVDFFDALITIGVIMASMVVHEFGHATACLRTTGATGAIRFLTYRGTPAMAADVSSICFADERGKAKVALGGALFQCLFGACVLATGIDALRMGASMAILGAMFSMTPLPNTDGYWVLRDYFSLALYPRLWRASAAGSVTDVLYGYALLAAIAGFSFMLFKQCLYLWTILSSNKSIFTLGNLAVLALFLYLVAVSCIFIVRNAKLFIKPSAPGL